MTRAGFARGGLGLILGVGLAGCVQGPIPESAPAPPPVRPAALAPAAPQVVPPRDDSGALAQYYRRVEAGLLAQGLLRRDGGGPDTPFTDEMLARNFLRVALFTEYAPGQGIRSSQTESRIKRWGGPIRLSVQFGDSVPPDQRAQDRNAVLSFARRLSRLTGVPISEAQGSAGTMNVLFVNEAERRALGPTLSRLYPGMDPATRRDLLTLPRDVYCVAVAFARGGSDQTSGALIIIRDEHPDLLRLACIHEEMSQAMGLANDSPQARPSIFNDDEEFALLTTHDEYLLQMLYDPRFRPGMTLAEAEPVARQVARELLGGGAS